MHELGLLDEFLKRPHHEVRELTGQIGEERVTLADFSHLPTRCHFIAFMPQWEFLDFLAEHARRYPSFHLRMQAEATDLVEVGGSVTGLKAKVPEGTLQVQADLVVGADGRHLAVRALEVDDLGAPLAAFRAAIVELNPALADRVQELASWDDLKLLTVRVDRLKRWYRPGLLCIGDAAHAMSPVGGVGINLAVQDAVAAANILALPSRDGPVPVELLHKVQPRREWPTRMMQALQNFIQSRIISNVLAMQTQPRPPSPSSCSTATLGCAASRRA